MPLLTYHFFLLKNFKCWLWNVVKKRNTEPNPTGNEVGWCAGKLQHVTLAYQPSCREN